MERYRAICGIGLFLAGLAALAHQFIGPDPLPAVPEGPRVVLPLGRTAYFIGERVPLAVTGDGLVRLELAGADGDALLHRGPAGPLLLDTTTLAPGNYTFQVDGKPTDITLTLTSLLRRSAGSLQDEFLPADGPNLTPAELANPDVAAKKMREYHDDLSRTLRETGLSASVSMAVSDMGRRPLLDTLARTGTLLLVNSDTRPTSFFPVSVDPVEIDGMSQRMILTAQANGRYPNFGGFCFSWDASGFAEGNRKNMLVWWAWGDHTNALRNYIDREQGLRDQEFTRRTGLKPVTQEEYLLYLVSTGRPEFAAVNDLPTKRWLEEAARHTEPMPAGKRAAFEKRLDAWGRYLMSLYNNGYSRQAANLREVSPGLRFTSSVQPDHAPVGAGQYIPTAYRSLDLRYQSAWSDQVGGPDYSYQWLFSAALLNMQRGHKPTWVSSTAGAAGARSDIPGKLVRVAAHNLAHGGSGVGFSHEGFSNVLGGISRDVYWPRVRDRAAGEDVRSVREFLDRFAALALQGRGDHGVGILYSKSQFARQPVMTGFGSNSFTVLVTLTRLGYTPRFITERELRTGPPADVKAILVLGQTVPLPPDVQTSLETFGKNGGRVLLDGSTTIKVTGSEKLGLTMPFTSPGKPTNWAVPNMPPGWNDMHQYTAWYRDLGPVLTRALGETGRGVFRSEAGPFTHTTLLQISGGRDAKYVVAVNDSHIRTQADWHQLHERIVPVKPNPGAVVHDCTEEKTLGKLRPLWCDLSRTTARIYAVLPRELKTIDLSATQEVPVGGNVIVEVAFADAAGKRLEAVLPFHLALVRPDEKTHQEVYRSTSAKGVFRVALPIPVNAPSGTWAVTVRCQLNGETATLPVTVKPVDANPLATPLRDPVIVREKAAIEKLLVKGTKVGLPLFAPAQAELLPAAKKVKEILAARGVEVEIWPQRPLQGSPGMKLPGLDAEPRDLATYWLDYETSPAHRAENDLVDRGELIGKLHRTTVNANDWYSAASGYRAGMPLILLDVVERAGVKGKMRGDNPLSAKLHRLGALWPEVSPAFPGKGKAIVQMVHWAFGQKAPALVIQAHDLQGLNAGVAALKELPDDVLTSSVQGARTALWSQYHVGRRPQPPPGGGLTANGMTTRSAPVPFAITFRGAEPLPAEKVVPAPAPTRSPVAVPGLVRSKAYVPFAREGDRFYETSTADPLLSDLRFSDAVQLIVDVKQPGRTKVSADGVFRYSDRRPRTQAGWEDVLVVYNRVVPRERRAMELEVRLGGKVVGKLVPSRRAEQDVALETLPAFATEKPRTVREEVVVELAGEIDLPAGRQELLLVPANIVDGQMRRVRVGISVEQAETIETARPKQ